MSKLTLDQVREAGRFAQHFGTDDDDSDDLEWWTNDGEKFVGGYTETDGCFEEVDAVYSGEYEQLPQDGWLHHPGCDCEFCMEA